MTTTVDTSVVVAAFASWHVAHRSAKAAVDAAPKLVAHCAIEAFSVLTRLPAPHRAPAALVVRYLIARFPDAPLALPGGASMRLLERALAEGISGGAIYDALVAATAAHHDATLLTLDARATDTYRRLGVRFRLLPS